VTDWTITELVRAIRARQASPVAATEACLERIERLDARLRAFVTVDREGALSVARAREAESLGGRFRGPLHGVPLAYKDLCFIPGLQTFCGTSRADYFVAQREATAVRRLTEAGAITLGKLNMSELAHGPFGDNPHHGDVQTPWRPGHVAGGSSSGSGAAMAAGLAFGALGTDTAGSIRLAAACCGIVGLKPTYGRVSRAGVMPLSWSLDHVGPMARTVRDVALLLGVVAGYDSSDPTSSRREVPPYVDQLDEPLTGLRAGVPENYYWDDLDPAVATGAQAAIDLLQGLGVKIVRLRVPDPQVACDVVTLLARPEAVAIHGRTVRQNPPILQPVVRARLELGFRISAHDYLQAARLRARIARTFVREVFEDVDVLLTPTIPEPAPALETVKGGTTEDLVLRMARFSRFTRPFNALGIPVLSVPCGFSSAGLPVGLQVAGRPFDEATVLRVGHAYERASTWRDRRLPFD
jgi:aspartyl-tRNA(Asn)/glutamyl-tRNA(Gln) amidotransferase subunit A